MNEWPSEIVFVGISPSVLLVSRQKTLCQGSLFVVELLHQMCLPYINYLTQEIRHWVLVLIFCHILIINKTWIAYTDIYQR